MKVVLCALALSLFLAQPEPGQSNLLTLPFLGGKVQVSLLRGLQFLPGKQKVKPKTTTKKPTGKCPNFKPTYKVDPCLNRTMGRAQCRTQEDPVHRLTRLCPRGQLCCTDFALCRLHCL